MLLIQGIHPGRLTAGTYGHHPFRKENDLNQTSRELCSMLIFRGVGFSINNGNLKRMTCKSGGGSDFTTIEKDNIFHHQMLIRRKSIPWIWWNLISNCVCGGQMGKTKHLRTLFWRTQEYPTQPFGDTRSDEVIICSCHWSFDHLIMLDIQGHRVATEIN